jgi:hypothetical protein
MISRKEERSIINRTQKLDAFADAKRMSEINPTSPKKRFSLLYL